MIDLIKRIKYLRETQHYVLAEFVPETSKQEYIITILYKNKRKYYCSCEYFLFRKEECKHLRLLRMYIDKKLPKKYQEYLESLAHKGL